MDEEDYRLLRSKLLDLAQVSIFAFMIYVIVVLG